MCSATLACLSSALSSDCPGAGAFIVPPSYAGNTPIDAEPFRTLMIMLRLSTYPHVVVHVACLTCKRLGSYRLARLAARFGPEAALVDVVAALAGECSGRSLKRHKGSYPVCGAMFSDLTRVAPPAEVAGVRRSGTGKR